MALLLRRWSMALLLRSWGIPLGEKTAFLQYFHAFLHGPTPQEVVHGPTPEELGISTT